MTSWRRFVRWLSPGVFSEQRRRFYSQDCTCIVTDVGMLEDPDCPMVTHPRRAGLRTWQ